MTGKFFSTKIMQFLGKISMSIYLVHVPLLYWLLFIIHGPKSIFPEDEEETANKLPIYGVAIHLIITLIVGTLLTKFVEEPAKNYFRKKIQVAYNQNVNPVQQDGNA